MTCKQCDDEYFTENGTQCLKGGIAFCKVYGNQQLQCTQCSNQYYLNQEGLCIPHALINNCTNYDSLTQDTCNTCDDISFLY